MEARLPDTACQLSCLFLRLERFLEQRFLRNGDRAFFLAEQKKKWEPQTVLKSFPWGRGNPFTWLSFSKVHSWIALRARVLNLGLPQSLECFVKCYVGIAKYMHFSKKRVCSFCQNLREIHHPPHTKKVTIHFRDRNSRREAHTCCEVDQQHQDVAGKSHKI